MADTVADFLLERLGELSGGVWEQLPAGKAWTIVMRAVLSAFSAHPWAWNEIGFGGPAYPRGYMRLSAGPADNDSRFLLDVRSGIPTGDWVSDEAGGHELYWTAKRLIGGEDPVELGKNNSGHGVGGSMVHHAGYAPRFHPSDFETRTRDGVGADWPISYWDLKTHYERVEAELPVAGQGWPWSDPHRYPHAAHPVSGQYKAPPPEICSEIGWAEHADHRAWHVPNRFVADGSVMRTQGSANPALTIMALASRLAERVDVKRVRRSVRMNVARA